MGREIRSQLLQTMTLSTAGTQYGRPLHTGRKHRVSLDLNWTAVASTAGAFFLQVSDDPRVAADVTNRTFETVSGSADTARWDTVALPSGSTSIGSNATVAASAGTITIDANAGYIKLNFETPHSWVRLGYTRSAGGGTAQATIYHSGRE